MFRNARPKVDWRAHINQEFRIELNIFYKDYRIERLPRGTAKLVHVVCLEFNSIPRRGRICLLPQTFFFENTKERLALETSNFLAFKVSHFSSNILGTTSGLEKSFLCQSQNCLGCHFSGRIFFQPGRNRAPRLKSLGAKKRSYLWGHLLDTPGHEHHQWNDSKFLFFW